MYSQLKGIELAVRRISYAELFQEFAGIDPHSADDEQLQAAVLAEVAIDPDGLRRDDFLDLLMTHCIEPQLPKLSLTVVYDFPASQCALARIRPGEVPVAERFELYLGSVELANGYHELTDAAEQSRRFDNDLRLRRQRGASAPPKDQRLIDALESMPDCAGVAMGIDRLMMALLDAEALAEVVAFDFSKGLRLLQRIDFPDKRNGQVERFLGPVPQYRLRQAQIPGQRCGQPVRA